MELGPRSQALEGSLITLDANGNELRRRWLKSAIHWSLPNDQEWNTTQSVECVDGFAGKQVVLWFRLADNATPTEFAVVVNTLPHGLLDNQGWRIPVGGMSPTIPALPRSHLLFHGAPVVDVAMSPDGSKVASVGGDGFVKVWEIESESLLQTWSGSAAEYSPDGKWLAIVGLGIRAKTVSLRDAMTGEEVRVFDGRHLLAVNRLVFSPDGRWLVTGGFDGIIANWELPPRPGAITE